MSFRKEEDVEGAKEKLRSWRSGLKIHGNTMERHNFGKLVNPVQSTLCTSIFIVSNV